MRFLYLLIWDALYCIVLAVSHFAVNASSSPEATYLITIATYLVCGAFLSQLRQTDALSIIMITIPAAYIAFSPFLAPGLAMLVDFLPITLQFNPVPEVLLASKTVSLRYACALAAGYTIFFNKQIGPSGGM